MENETVKTTYQVEYVFSDARNIEELFLDWLTEQIRTIAFE